MLGKQKDGLTRLFFTAWPDPAGEIKNLLENARILRQLIDCRDARSVVSKNLHMTLVFIGGVSCDQATLLEGSAHEILLQPCVVELDHWWRTPSGCVAATASFVPPILARLRADLLSCTNACVEQALSAGRFRPHITLLRGVRPQELPNMPHHLKLRLTVQHFSLVQSLLQPSGARYKSLHDYQMQCK